MQFSSLFGHTYEVLSTIFTSIFVEKLSIPPDQIINTFFRSHKYLGANDRRFIAENTYSTLRHFRRNEFIVQQSIADFQPVISSDDRLLLILAITNMKSGEDSERVMNALEARIRNSQLRGFLGKLVPRISQSSIQYPLDSAHRLSIEYSFPDWMVKKIIHEYGEGDAEKICSAFNSIAPICLRVNTLITTVKQCELRLRSEGVETYHANFSPFGLIIKKRLNIFSLQSFRDGWFEVQDEGSQLLPLLVDPKPVEKILDVCAGAGGKTLEFAALMKNRGEICATDINSFRLDELRRRAKRAGVHNVHTSEIASVDDLEKNYRNYFDVVFIDAPCSGLGTIRRNPGMKWSVTEQTVQEVVKKQEGILNASASLVKPGGKLVYATCTILREENEFQIDNFLSRHKTLSLIPLSTVLKKFGIAISADQSLGKLLPHLHGTDAFFCAIMEKLR